VENIQPKPTSPKKEPIKEPSPVKAKKQEDTIEVIQELDSGRRNNYRGNNYDYYGYNSDYRNRNNSYNHYKKFDSKYYK
jgi:hypothetical protein